MTTPNAEKKRDRPIDDDGDASASNYGGLRSPDEGAVGAAQPVDAYSGSLEGRGDRAKDNPSDQNHLEWREAQMRPPAGTQPGTSAGDTVAQAPASQSQSSSPPLPPEPGNAGS